MRCIIEYVECTQDHDQWLHEYSNLGITCQPCEEVVPSMLRDEKNAKSLVTYPTYQKKSFTTQWHLSFSPHSQQISSDPFHQQKRQVNEGRVMAIISNRLSIGIPNTIISKMGNNSLKTGWRNSLKTKESSTELLRQSTYKATGRLQLQTNSYSEN